MFTSGIVPPWFYIMVLIVCILFVVIGYWVTRSEKGLHTGGDGKLARRAIYYENRFSASAKPAEMIDVKTNYVGYVKRHFNSLLHHLLAFFSPRRSIRLSAETGDGKLGINLHHVKNQTRFLFSSWEGEVTTSGIAERFTIESKSEKKSKINLSFTYKGEMFHVLSNLKENEIRVEKNGVDIATVSYQRKLPPRQVFIDSKEGELPLLLLACIFEVVKYYD